MNFGKLLKKLFGKRDKGKLPPAPWTINKTCINCLKSIPKEDIICNECGHNQSLPVKKKPIPIHGMAEVIGTSASTGQQDIIDLINQFAGELVDNQTIINRAYVEIMTAKLSISYIIILINYKNHYNYSNIIDGIETEINKRFNHLFGEEKNDEVWRYFRKRLNQYLDAFKDENLIETISTMLQFILEKTIEGKDKDIEVLEHYKPLKIIAKEWAYPLFTHNMACAILVGNYIEFFTLWSNRWEIK